MLKKAHDVKTMKQHIYRILTSERRRLGLSQQQLAALAGLRREKVSRVESKAEDIGLDELSRLLDAVGLELAVREKAAPSLSAREKPPAARLGPQEFRKVSFIDGSQARIVSWGVVPK